MSSRTTRGRAPGTSISLAHSSGTSWKPILRAARAGNSAVRSGVAVKTTLITSSVTRPLRVMTSVTSSVVPSRTAVRSLAPIWTAPRIALTATGLIPFPTPGNRPGDCRRSRLSAGGRPHRARGVSQARAGAAPVAAPGAGDEGFGRAGHGSEGPRPGPRGWPGPARLIRPQGAAGPPLSGLTRGATGAAGHRGEYPAQEGGGAAVSAGGLRRVVIIRPLARRGRRTGRGGPGSSAFHGLHGVEDSRARHDAPSTGQFCRRSVPPPRHLGQRQPCATGPTISDTRGGLPSLWLQSGPAAS